MHTCVWVCERDVMIACESEMLCFLLFRCAFCRVSFVCVPSCVCACVHVSVRVYTRDKTQMCTWRHSSDVYIEAFSEDVYIEAFSEDTYTAHTLHTGIPGNIHVYIL